MPHKMTKFNFLEEEKMGPLQYILVKIELGLHKQYKYLTVGQIKQESTLFQKLV